MSTQIQYLRGSAAQLNSFTGVAAEIVVDTTDWTLRVLDGATTGGYALVGLTQTQTLTNKTLVTPTITGAVPTLSVTGNVQAGNISTAGLISATGNVTGNFFIGNGSALTGVVATGIGTLASLNVTGTTTSGQFSGAGNTLSNIQGANVTGNVSSAVLAYTAYSVAGANVSGTVSSATTATSATTAGTVTTAAQGNITSVGTLSSLSVSGAITVAGGIVNGGSNAAGNIGSSSSYFDTVFAKATSAQYADLAEMYCADIKYPPGTVVEFGGDFEVTKTTSTHSTAVAGIVSTNPSYLMNATLDCSTAIEVALVGRVPCFVVGTIRKGDRLVSSNVPGVATSLKVADYQPGCIVGKALEAYDSEEVGTIEVAVGRV